MRGAPVVTRCPSWNVIALMRPAVSGRRVTDSSERRLPTAVIVVGMGAVMTLAASTTTLAPAACCPLPFAGGAPEGDATGGVDSRWIPIQYPAAAAPMATAAAAAIAAVRLMRVR